MRSPPSSVLFRSRAELWKREILNLAERNTPYGKTHPVNKHILECICRAGVGAPSRGKVSNDGINAFDSHATFTSYSAAPGDREDLLKKVPVEHKKILESLEFVVEVEDAEEHGKKLVAVHAGLETDCPFDVQMTALRQRRVDQAWVEALQGRAERHKSS